jgi:hypothetical protein
LSVHVSADPILLIMTTPRGEVIQRLHVASDTGIVSFLTGDSPLLGLGEGGPQFDRRGSTDAMVSGQGGYHLATHGLQMITVGVGHERNIQVVEVQLVNVQHPPAHLNIPVYGRTLASKVAPFKYAANTAPSVR